MRINVTLSGADRVRHVMEQIGAKAARQALDATAEDAEDYILQQAAKHNVHGSLVRSIDKRRTADGQGWEVYHDPQVAPHALFVHWGTKPHVIRPKGGIYTSHKDINGKTRRKGIPKEGRVRKMLRWPVGGRFVFAREVNHPGTRSDTWMVRAADLAPRMFAWHLDTQLQKLKG